MNNFVKKISFRIHPDDSVTVTLQKFHIPNTTPVKRQSKRLILSTNVDQKSLETEFLMAICCLTGEKMAIKNTVSIDF